MVFWGPKTISYRAFGAMLSLRVRVQMTGIWSMSGSYIRNRTYGFGYIPSIWVLGPLGWDKGSCFDFFFGGVQDLKDQMNHKIEAIYHVLFYFQYGIRTINPFTSHVHP